jgi:hypothetical protein
MKRVRHTRDITAPKFESSDHFFNHTNESSSSVTIESKTDGLDEKQRFLPPLEDVDQVTLEKYCGPTPESNWVIPNRLLVGAYPASENDEEVV